MSDVKIIPITPAYRQNYERIFQRQETQEDWERPNGGRSYVRRLRDDSESVTPLKGACEGSTPSPAASK